MQKEIIRLTFLFNLSLEWKYVFNFLESEEFKRKLLIFNLLE